MATRSAKSKAVKAAKYKIFDGHNDTLLSIFLPERGKGRTFFERNEVGHIDLPRAREGGFRGGFFAIFTPAYPPHSFMDQMTIKDGGYSVQMEAPLDQAFALKHTLGMMRLLFTLEKQSNGQLKVVRTADELDACLATGSASDGPIAAVAHIEGAEAIDGSLDALYILHAAGLRSLGPVWSRPTIFGYGVPFQYPASPDTGPGLTDAGKRLVKACNELGVLIDLSHINEKGFWDVAELSDAPLVVTHTAAHELCAFTRNITDKQIDAVGASGGIVGVIYGVGNLRRDGNGERTTETPISDIVRHIQYVVDRIGIEHVALGSDFDGTSIPAELGDVAGLPKLTAQLQAAGFDDDALNKLTHANWQRVFRQTWK